MKAPDAVPPPTPEARGRIAIEEMGIAGSTIQTVINME